MDKTLRFFEQRVLNAYSDSSFVYQQKANVMFWLHILLIPTLILYIFINVWRNHPDELLNIIILDCLFLAAMLLGLPLLKQGRLSLVAHIDIGMAFLVACLGSFAKLPSQIVTGFNSFSVFFLVAVVFTAMFGSRKMVQYGAIGFIVLISVTHAITALSISPHLNVYLVSGTLNVLIAVVIIFCISYWNSQIMETALETTQKELEKNLHLQKQLEQKVEARTNELKVLKGLIPICSLCKNIRDDKGYWNRIEAYISSHTEAEFSHSICPDCAKTYYADLDKLKEP